MTPVNETLAQYSELFMLIAALIYLVAFLFFSWDMATASKSIRTLEAELETEKAKELVGSDGATVIDNATPTRSATKLVSTNMVYNDVIKRKAATIAVSIVVMSSI